MRVKEIPILLLTGYLGSGKTTLVNHILSNKRGIKSVSYTHLDVYKRQELGRY